MTTKTPNVTIKVSYRILYDVCRYGGCCFKCIPFVSFSNNTKTEWQNCNTLLHFDKRLKQQIIYEKKEEITRK